MKIDQPMKITSSHDSKNTSLIEIILCSNKKRRGQIVVLCVWCMVLLFLANRRKNVVLEIRFQCPQTIKKADNDNNGHLSTEYTSSEGGTFNPTDGEFNVSEFIHSFRETKNDNWGRTYETVKEGMYHWKSTMYPDFVDEGDSIYESACGLGLNLYMTLEILHEMKGLESLAVYGNDYFADSAHKAKAFLDQAAPFHTSVKSICGADSTDLSHAPSNLFDLVFTGYITPIYDPLDIGRNLTVNEMFKIYESICEGTDEQSQLQANLTQQIQNDFYAAWVGEMIRIAKPGKAVIVEQVSYPYCEEYRDWGGVNRQFWHDAIDKYSWNVDPKSIVFEKDVIFRNRYHVFMQKKR